MLPELILTLTLNLLLGIFVGTILLIASSPRRPDVHVALLPLYLATGNQSIKNYTIAIFSCHSYSNIERESYSSTLHGRKEKSCVEQTLCKFKKIATKFRLHTNINLYYFQVFASTSGLFVFLCTNQWYNPTDSITWATNWMKFEPTSIPFKHGQLKVSKKSLESI